MDSIIFEKFHKSYDAAMNQDRGSTKHVRRTRICTILATESNTNTQKNAHISYVLIKSAHYTLLSLWNQEKKINLATQLKVI